MIVGWSSTHRRPTLASKVVYIRKNCITRSTMNTRSTTRLMMNSGSKYESADSRKHTSYGVMIATKKMAHVATPSQAVANREMRGSMRYLRAARMRSSSSLGFVEHFGGGGGGGGENALAARTADAAARHSIGSGSLGTGSLTARSGLKAAAIDAARK